MVREVSPGGGRLCLRASSRAAGPAGAIGRDGPAIAPPRPSIDLARWVHEPMIILACLCRYARHCQESPRQIDTRLGTYHEVDTDSSACYFNQTGSQSSPGSAYGFWDANDSEPVADVDTLSSLLPFALFHFLFFVPFFVPFSLPPNSRGSDNPTRSLSTSSPPAAFIRPGRSRFSLESGYLATGGRLDRTSLKSWLGGESPRDSRANHPRTWE